MATRTTTTLTCDFPHYQGEEEATETLVIGWDGKTLEADACGNHAEAIRGALGPYITRMRVTSVRREERRTTASRHRSAQIREWARAQGMAVNDHGRLPAGILAAHKARVK